MNNSECLCQNMCISRTAWPNFIFRVSQNFRPNFQIFGFPKIFGKLASLVYLEYSEKSCFIRFGDYCGLQQANGCQIRSRVHKGLQIQSIQILKLKVDKKITYPNRILSQPYVLTARRLCSTVFL